MYICCRCVPLCVDAWSLGSWSEWPHRRPTCTRPGCSRKSCSSPDTAHPSSAISEERGLAEICSFAFHCSISTWTFPQSGRACGFYNRAETSGRSVPRWGATALAATTNQHAPCSTPLHSKLLLVGWGCLLVSWHLSPQRRSCNSYCEFYANCTPFTCALKVGLNQF